MLSQALIRSVGALAAVLCLPLATFAESSSVRWRNNLDAAKVEAIQSNRLLLLHFSSKSCAPCKVLDQTVFSQPQVGPAIEKEYVPVRIDRDASPALASSFRIDRVPTEIVMTPQGNVVATLSLPDNADAYLAQLQNLARHCRQTTSAAQASRQPVTNPAYAALPVSPQPASSASPLDGRSPAGPSALASGPTAGEAPLQMQTNPFAAGASAQGPTASLPAGSPAYAPQTSPYGAPGAQGVAQSNLSAAPAMPANAMPRSYRDPLPEVAPAGAIAASNVAGAVAPPAATSAVTPTATAPPVAAAATATTAAVAAKPSTPKLQLPPGAPPVAFDGCCPVTLKTVKRWTAGNAALGVVHRGRTYLFVGENERQQFWADPDAYSPVFAGLDPVLLLEKQQSVEGSRQFGYEYGGLFYLFSSEETKQRFAASPNSYAAGVRQAMSRIDAAQGGVIRR